MKKDRSGEAEGRYWQGTSSLEEERDLMEMGGDAYFQALREAKKERMDFRFDAFLRSVSDIPSVCHGQKPISERPYGRCLGNLKKTMDAGCFGYFGPKEKNKKRRTVSDAEKKDALSTINRCDMKITELSKQTFSKDFLVAAATGCCCCCCCSWGDTVVVEQVS